jgi:hypothetical protein
MLVERGLPLMPQVVPVPVCVICGFGLCVSVYAYIHVSLEVHVYELVSVQVWSSFLNINGSMHITYMVKFSLECISLCNC